MGDVDGREGKVEGVNICERERRIIYGGVMEI